MQSKPRRLLGLGFVLLLIFAALIGYLIYRLAEEDRGPDTDANPGAEAMTAEGFSQIAGFAPFGWVDESTKWDSAEIPVCLSGSALNNPREVQWLKDALASSWEAHSDVNFVGFEPCKRGAAGIHVSFADRGARTLGLGKELDGKNRGLRLNPVFGRWNKWCAENDALRQSCFKASVVHEFGHALGFAHEHNRADTPETCKDPAQGPDGTLVLTPWDPDSIMNYCNKARWRDGGKLSDGDKLSVAIFYGDP